MTGERDLEAAALLSAAKRRAMMLGALAVAFGSIVVGRRRSVERVERVAFRKACRQKATQPILAALPEGADICAQWRLNTKPAVGAGLG